MSSSINDMNYLSQNKVNLNIYSIDPNSLIAMNFNFDILKFVITELINNQKNTKIELSKINTQLQELENQIKISENKRILELQKSINIDKEKNNINKEDNINTEVKINEYNKYSEEIKTIMNDIKNIKSKQLEQVEDFNKYKIDIEQNIPKKINEFIPKIEDNILTKFQVEEKKLKEQIRKNKDDINAIKEQQEQNNKKILNNLSDINNNKIKEIKKSIELLDLKINNINNNFSLYTTLNDFDISNNKTNEHIKNVREDINKNVELLRREFNSIKNQVLEHINNKTDHNNLLSLLERFINIETSVYELNDFKIKILEKEKKRIDINPKEFVNIDIFEKFIKNYNKECDDNKKQYQKIKKDLDNLIMKEGGNKATLKDLKNIEDKIMQRFEDFEESISMKFVDKNLLNKNKKLIEIQTKKLIEENKKEEKNDNWLIAKKSLEGHLCASCESFIGNLNTNLDNKYIPWNKYPQKDSPEKIYKIYGGISNLINIFNTKLNNLNSNYKNSINNTNLENNSNNNIKFDSDEFNTSIYSINDKSVTDKNIQVGSFSNKFQEKMNHNLKNEDTLNNINKNNLPILPKSINKLQKNNSSFNLFSASNAKAKSFKGIINNMKKNNLNNTNNKTNINLVKKKLKIENDDNDNDNSDLYSNINKHVLTANENDKEKTEPKIVKIVKKH